MAGSGQRHVRRIPSVRLGWAAAADGASRQSPELFDTTFGCCPDPSEVT
jgi:hypothetical protein